MIAMLQELGQAHLCSDWSNASDEDKKRLLSQLAQLDNSYPGGLRAYVTNARRLLNESKLGVNPLEGWTPSVPTGVSLKFASQQFVEHEAVGEAELHACSFVLVAGGLGERLGFSGIKVALPYQISTEDCYLKFYIRSILALQQRATELCGRPVELPLAIMVSEDTMPGTKALLAANNNFGMKPNQVTLLKQEKVPCLSDNDAHLSLDPKDPFRILTKPHGHGDVHYLLHSSGTIQTWRQMGVRWVYFFQDTNAPAFKVLPACLGVSKNMNLEVNSVCVARKAGEAIGGIMTLTSTDERKLTVNVEYNQIDALLKATVEPQGDINGPDGFSAYPGSINQLILALDPYASKLNETGGGMPEFVNPKYTDGTKTAFKAPTRLECMMQDYPKSLDSKAVVGFSVITDTIAFSPVKTNLADAKLKIGTGMPTYSAISGEADVYVSNCEMLAAAGVQVPCYSPMVRAGVEIKESVRVVIDPSFGSVLEQWKAKLPTPDKIKLEPGSTLILKGDLSGLLIEELYLKGALVVELQPCTQVTLKRVRVDNAGWSFQELPADSNAPEPLAIRGYCIERAEQRELSFEKAGAYEIDDDKVQCSML